MCVCDSAPVRASGVMSRNVGGSVVGLGQGQGMGYPQTLLPFPFPSPTMLMQPQFTVTSSNLDREEGMSSSTLGTVVKEAIKAGIEASKGSEGSKSGSLFHPDKKMIMSYVLEISGSNSENIHEWLKKLKKADDWS